MGRLFIIGNGFDIAHEINSGYEDFHDYLKRKYTVLDDANVFSPPETTMDKDGDLYCTGKDAADFFNYIINITAGDCGEWKDFENSLGQIDYGEFFDWAGMGGGDNPWHEVYYNEDKASDIFSTMHRAKQFFEDWINDIDISNVKPHKNIQNLIDNKEDFFLTFNYTRLLEEKYDVQNICHIHGTQGEDIIYGHGNKANFIEEYMSKYIGAEGSLQEVKDFFIKDVESIISANQWFFSMLAENVTDIYSYGFSYSEVDMPYIREICKLLNAERRVWYLQKRGNSDVKKENKRKIIQCGFNGKIDFFQV